MDTKEIGKRIKKYRERSNLTTTELSEKLGISQATLSKYENGKIDGISMDRLTDIASALDVSLSTLIDYIEETPSVQLINKLTQKTNKGVITWLNLEDLSEKSDFNKLYSNLISRKTEINDAVLDILSQADLPINSLDKKTSYVAEYKNNLYFLINLYKLNSTLNPIREVYIIFFIKKDDDIMHISDDTNLFFKALSSLRDAIRKTGSNPKDLLINELLKDFED